jgi:amino acid permease
MDLLHQLKDIKPNVEIVDYYFYVFIVACLILVALLIFFAFKFLKKEKNPYLVKLQHLDFNDSKKVAYEFTKYAKYFLNENNKDEYKSLVKELEKYKYKPIVNKLEEKTIKKIKKFIEDIK